MKGRPRCRAEMLNQVVGVVAAGRTGRDGSVRT